MTITNTNVSMTFYHQSRRPNLFNTRLHCIEKKDSRAPPHPTTTSQSLHPVMTRARLPCLAKGVKGEPGRRPERGAAVASLSAVHLLPARFGSRCDGGTRRVSPIVFLDVALTDVHLISPAPLARPESRVQSAHLPPFGHALRWREELYL